MTFFTASFETIVLRYYLMMAVIIASFSLGFPAFAILGFPIFISAITAISFKPNKKQIEQKTSTNNIKKIRQAKTAA